MIKLFVKEMMEQRGYDAKPHELQKIGINYTTAIDILKGKVSNLKLSTLTKLCVMLHCTPNDILNYTNTDALQPKHPLLELIKQPHIKVNDLLSKLSAEQLAEFAKIAQAMIQE